MQAWVVSVESLEAAKGPGCPKRILALFSARRTQSYLSDQLDTVYRLFRADIREQLDASQWNNPAELKSNVRVDGTCLYCAHGPYVFRAQLSDDVEVQVEGEERIVRWKQRSHRRIREDPETHQLIDEGEQTYEAQEAPQAEFLLEPLFA